MQPSGFYVLNANGALKTQGGTSSGSSGVTMTFARKTSDENRTSTTLTADGQLTFSVAANEVWEFEFVVRYQGDAGSDVRMGLKFPTSPTEIAYNIIGPYTSMVKDVSNVNFGDTIMMGGFTADAVSGLLMGAETIASVAILKGIVRNGSNAGSVTLWWAPNTAPSTVTTVKSGSYVKAFKIS